MKKLILACFGLALFLLALLACLDREIARRDYVRGDIASGCIFQTNCNYYNRLLYK